MRLCRSCVKILLRQPREVRSAQGVTRGAVCLNALVGEAAGPAAPGCLQAPQPAQLSPEPALHCPYQHLLIRHREYELSGDPPGATALFLCRVLRIFVSPTFPCRCTGCSPPGSQPLPRAAPWRWHLGTFWVVSCGGVQPWGAHPVALALHPHAQTNSRHTRATGTALLLPCSAPTKFSIQADQNIFRVTALALSLLLYVIG